MLFILIGLGSMLFISHPALSSRLAAKFTNTATNQVSSVISTIPLQNDLDMLVVKKEPYRTGYDRALFPHWLDTDNTGCNTRQDELQDQVQGSIKMAKTGCYVISGVWLSIYDDILYTGLSKGLDADHVVALAEAWDSGANSWSLAKRTAFANDRENILIVTANSNREKSDSDVAKWLPPSQKSWCKMATIVVTVKLKYHLSVDTLELASLVKMLQTC
jgi:hypothetical protein